MFMIKYLIIFLMFVPISVSAVVIADQLVSDTSQALVFTNDGSGGEPTAYYVMTGLSGTLKAITLRLQDYGGGVDARVRINIVGCGTASPITNACNLFSGPIESNWFYATTTSPARIQTTASAVNYRVTTFNDGTGETLFTFDPLKYYIIQAGHDVVAAPDDFLIYGSNANTSIHGPCWRDISAGGGRVLCSTVDDFYFSLEVFDDYEATTTTRIIAVNSPQGGSVTATDFVEFNFDYYYNSVTGGYERAGVDLRDLEDNLSLAMYEQSIVSSGGGTYSDSIFLTIGKYYMWRPYLVGSFGYLYGDWQVFSVVSASSTPFVLGSLLDDDTASTTDRLLNFPARLMERFPFNLVEKVGLLFDTASSSASIATTTIITLHFGYGPSATTTTYDMQPIADLPLFVYLRMVMLYIMYFVAALGVIGAVIKFV